MDEPITLEPGKRYKFLLKLSRTIGIRETTVGNCSGLICYPWDVDKEKYIEVDKDMYIMSTVLNIEKNYDMIAIDMIDIEYL